LPLSILDVGGADTPLSEELLGLIDYISPNETELERILDVVKKSTP
jgi:sugar/nucleoside kinase (ribokinase family)